ncbi:MAG: hypothetical protein L3J02_01530 [Henriciella sp.]|nr:hypothetical protein [Henriciella sp.]
MELKYYRLGLGGIREINHDEFLDADKNKKELFLVDIRTTKREKAIERVKTFGIAEAICEHLLDPADHIRFEYFGNQLYGELAHFSPTQKTSTYSALLIKQNIFIGIHPEKEEVLMQIHHSKGY